ncbi:MAG TPA: hypothetical protein VGC42_28790 [Kofleriaceae bacterium]
MYRGSSEGAIAAFFEHANVAMTSSDAARVEQAFRDAMEQLVLLHHYQAVHGPLSAERLAEFRRQSAPLLATSPHLGAYIWRAQFLAEGANENYWYELSMRRSAIQLAIDDYPGWPVADQIKLDDVDALDTELRRVGQFDEQGPIDPAYIPHDLPANHWWWHYPEQFK